MPDKPTKILIEVEYPNGSTWKAEILGPATSPRLDTRDADIEIRPYGEGLPVTLEPPGWAQSREVTFSFTTGMNTEISIEVDDKKDNLEEPGNGR